MSNILKRQQATFIEAHIGFFINLRMPVSSGLVSSDNYFKKRSFTDFEVLTIKVTKGHEKLKS